MTHRKGNSHMMLLREHELFDRVDEIKDLCERSEYILEELVNDFFTPLAKEKTPKEERILLTTPEVAHRYEVFATMVFEMIDTAGEKLALLRRAILPGEDQGAEQPPTEAEQADEIVNDILRAVEKIENAPNWARNLEKLRTTSIMLAQGFEDVNVTGKPPKD